MQFLSLYAPYLALLLTQGFNSSKQFAMKKCGGIAPGPFNSVCINMARTIICFFVSLVLWWIADRGVTTTVEGHIIILVGGIGTAFNLFAWILSSRAVSLLLLESITTVTTMIIPMLLAPILYGGEKASLLQWVGSAMILGSLFLFSEKKEKTKQKGSFLPKVGVVSLCAISAGLAAIAKRFYNVRIEKSGNGSIAYYTFLGFVVVLVVFAVLFVLFYGKESHAAKRTGGKIALPYKRVWPYILLAAASLYAVEYLSAYAAKLPDGIYYPLSRGLMAFATFLLDALVFKDKVSLKKIIGLILVITALVLVNVNL